VQQILDALTGAAAFVRNDRLDILGGNRLGYALYAPMFENPLRRPANTARFVFLDPRARGHTRPDGRHPGDRSLVTARTPPSVFDPVDHLAARHAARHTQTVSEGLPRRRSRPGPSVGV
jgi:hypothetical protein